MKDKAQMIKGALLLVVLILLVYSLMSGKSSEEIPVETTASQTRSVASEETTYMTKTSTTAAESSSSTAGTVATTTEVTTTAETESSGGTTGSVTTTAEDTASATITTVAKSSGSTTGSSTTTIEVTTAVPETKKLYGPYVLEDISSYNIIDPTKDYTHKSDPQENICSDYSFRGIVRVFFEGEGDYKVRIEKGETAYNYDLESDGQIEVFPLQSGPGEYRVMILKKIVDTRYSVIKSKHITADIKDQNLVYINSVQNIYWLPQMPPVMFAGGSLIDDLLNGGDVPKEKLDSESFRLLWSYIISNIYYDKDKYSNISNLIGYVPDINATFNEKKGICYDYASFMSALLRSFAVPVKLVAGYCPSYYGDSYHAWNEVFIDGEWITVDVTYDAAYYQSGEKVQFEKKKSLYTAIKSY